MILFNASQIKEARKEKGWSTAEFARKIGKPRQQVDQWERGYRTPNAKMIAILASGLGVLPNVFFTQVIDGKIENLGIN